MPPSLPPTANSFLLFSRVLIYIGLLSLFLGILCPTGVHMEHLEPVHTFEIFIGVSIVKLSALLFGGSVFVSGVVLLSKSSVVLTVRERIVYCHLRGVVCVCSSLWF
jgi:hypothetical protein